jgi:hypothetical protein
MKSKHQLVIIQSINKNLVLKIFCSFLLCLIFGIALPAHHHEDGFSHDDCAFCMLQKSVSPIEVVFSVASVVIIVAELSQAAIRFYNPNIIFSFHSRAPPVLSLS